MDVSQPALQDLPIDQLVRRYTKNPVMVIIDVKPKELGIPTEAYVAVEEILEGKQQQWSFKHVPSEIGALEAEEVGVEHLLRDVKDMTISTLANQVAQKLASLKGLGARLQEVDAYLQNVLSGRMPVNHRIIYQLQDVFNLLPNLNVEELVKAFAVKTNDMMLAIYLSSVIRSTVALHNLIVSSCNARTKPLGAQPACAEQFDRLMSPLLRVTRRTTSFKIRRKRPQQMVKRTAIRKRRRPLTQRLPMPRKTKLRLTRRTRQIDEPAMNGTLSMLLCQ